MFTAYKKVNVFVYEFKMTSHGATEDHMIPREVLGRHPVFRHICSVRLMPYVISIFIFLLSDIWVHIKNII